MSVRTMSLVFEYDMPDLKTDDNRTVPDSTAKFVLLALADHCNDEGEGAYPGVKRICRKTSMSAQTVCNALNALRHNGYTTKLEEKSKSGTSNYTIHLNKLLQPLGFQPLESADSSHWNRGILATRVKPSINHPINHQELEREEIEAIKTAITEAIGKPATDGWNEIIDAWHVNHETEWIRKAILKAKRNNARSLAYIGEILDGWKANGYPKTRRTNGTQPQEQDPDKYTRGNFSEFIE